MRTAFAVFFVCLAVPSALVIGWIAGYWFWFAAGALWADPGDADTWSLAFILPGGPLLLGVVALTLFLILAGRYVLGGPRLLAGQRGKLVGGLFIALIPLAIALPFGLLLMLRGGDAFAIATALFGSGLFPLIGAIWLLVISPPETATQPAGPDATTQQSL